MRKSFESLQNEHNKYTSTAQLICCSSPIKTPDLHDNVLDQLKKLPHLFTIVTPLISRRPLANRRLTESSPTFSVVNRTSGNEVWNEILRRAPNVDSVIRDRTEK
ncbi:hypothetical protein Trydic_g14124 [Trypoxylus dichotomus]